MGSWLQNYKHVEGTTCTYKCFTLYPLQINDDYKIFEVGSGMHKKEASLISTLFMGQKGCIW